MTLDKLARLVATGFSELRGEMATKADKADIERLEHKVNRLDLRVEEVHDVARGSFKF